MIFPRHFGKRHLLKEQYVTSGRSRRWFRPVTRKFSLFKKENITTPAHIRTADPEALRNTVSFDTISVQDENKALD